MPTFALAMIVRDEVSSVGSCLESVVGVVDECVIVDTGSQDGTQDVVRSFLDRFPGLPVDPAGPSKRRHPGITLLERKWDDDFSAARNHGLEHVHAEWVLFLDADERLISTRDEVRQELDGDATGLLVRMFHSEEVRRLVQGERYTSLLRIFRNDPGVKFVSPVHEHLDIEAALQRQTALEVAHTRAPDRQRIDRNIRILRKLLRERPADRVARTALGIEFFHSHQDLEAARQIASACKEADLSDPWLASRAVIGALSLALTGSESSAVDLLKRIEVASPSYTDVVYLSGEIALARGERRRAIQLARECLSMSEPPVEYHSIGGCSGYRAQDLRAAATSTSSSASGKSRLEAIAYELRGDRA